MDGTTIAVIITAIGGPTTIAALYKWAKAQGKAEAIQDQSASTITAMKDQITELEQERNEYKSKLWELLAMKEKE